MLDEKPYQLIGQSRERIIKSNGSILEDYEYVRNGVAQIYMCFEPLGGKRWINVRDTHNRFDWVAVVSGLLDNQYSDTSLISLVQDNHSAHKPQAFYEVYEAHKAKQYLDRLNLRIYARSWQLAEYGRIRTQRAIPAGVGQKDR